MRCRIEELLENKVIYQHFTVISFEYKVNRNKTINKSRQLKNALKGAFRLAYFFAGSAQSLAGQSGALSCWARYSGMQAHAAQREYFDTLTSIFGFFLLSLSSASFLWQCSLTVHSAPASYTARLWCPLHLLFLLPSFNGNTYLFKQLCFCGISPLLTTFYI